jgi:hypothetical protein
MRNVAAAMVLLALVAGCGSGGKKTPELTKAQYAAALSKLCSNANRQVAALRLTADIKTWKQNGQKAAKIAARTVKGFEELTPPKTLADASEKYNKATDELAAAVQDAADAAKGGDITKFDDAISRQQNAGTMARGAASEIGAKACAGG